MAKYIVIFSVGPVQSMITAARRSRDLWSGSALLSELAKACAHYLCEQKATLIFPAVESITELEPNSDFSVGNKIQVAVDLENNDQVHELVKGAKEATQKRFLDEADLVRKEIGESNFRTSVWAQQVKDYLEIQAAWAKVVDDTSYSQAVDLASKTLAARKATRDFAQINANPYDDVLMIPKSSLDGARETVLLEDKKVKLQTRRKLGLSQSEQLDCLGVIKRLGLKKQAEQFTPFSRVTAHTWINAVLKDEESTQQLELVKKSYESLVKLGLATGVKGNISSDGQSIYHAFPYDAQFLYPSRLEAAILENQYELDYVHALSELKKELKFLWRKHGEPCSYGVLLLADGDRMGELLDKAKNQNDHQKMTQALSTFAGSVAEEMRKFSGHCIYAGGDDVLGFVPLSNAYECAQSLSDLFAEKLKGVAQQAKVAIAPTLSVGLAICHHMTPLGIIRELAQKAEKFAKGDHILDTALRRNALGICLDVRSGNNTMLRFRWDNLEAHDYFKTWISLYVKKAISSRIAYDTRAIDLRIKNITTDKELHKNIQMAEFKRMLMQARVIQGGQIDKDHQMKLEARASEISLQELSDELIVARWFAAKTQQDLGKDGV